MTEHITPTPALALAALPRCLGSCGTCWPRIVEGTSVSMILNTRGRRAGTIVAVGVALIPGVLWWALSLTPTGTGG
jgi:hypothetical protein